MEINEISKMRKKWMNVIRKAMHGQRGGKLLRRRIHSIDADRLLSQQFFGNESATKTINPHKLNRVNKSISNMSNIPSAKLVVWNARSIRGRKKTSAIIDLVMSEHLDINGSWLSGDQSDDIILSDLQNALLGYVMHKMSFYYASYSKFRAWNGVVCCSAQVQRIWHRY